MTAPKKKCPMYGVNSICCDAMSREPEAYRP